MPKISLARQRFFDTHVHMNVWKDSMSAKNEGLVQKAIENMGYVFDKDFVRQHPIAERFVLDFAFVNEKIAIEVDGDTHRSKKMMEKDKVRDRFLYLNEWVVIRIPEKKFFGKSSLFFRYLIRDVVEERRRQYEEGRLIQKDMPNFYEGDW